MGAEYLSQNVSLRYVDCLELKAIKKAVYFFPSSSSVAISHLLHFLLSSSSSSPHFSLVFSPSSSFFFCFFLNCLNNLDRGLIPGRKQIPKITLYSQKTYLLGQTSICLPHICSSHLPVYCLPPIWSHRHLPISPLLRVVYKPQVPDCFGGSSTYKVCFSLVKISYTNLIIRPTKEPRREELFLFCSIYIGGIVLAKF